MTKVEIWETETNIDILHIYKTVQEELLLNETYNLYINKPSYTLIEKYIIDIIKYHLSQLQIIDDNNYYIEFKLNNTFVPHKIDIIKNITPPLLSCIMFLSDNKNVPFIFTCIDHESYLYKKFEDNNELVICYPENTKHVTYDCNCYHGYINTRMDSITSNPLYFLDIKVKYKTDEGNITNVISIYNNESINSSHVITKITDKLPVYNYNVNKFKFINELLYDNNFYNVFKLHLMLYNYNETIFKIELGENNKNNSMLLLENDNCMNIYKNIKYTRFIQRFKINNAINQQISKTIIEHIHPTNSDKSYKPEENIVELNMSTSNNIFPLCVYTLLPILQHITQLYNIENYEIDIKKIQVSRYTEKTCYAYTKEIQTLLSLSVCLHNDTKVKGEYYFQDGLCTTLCNGDAIVFSNIMQEPHGFLVSDGEMFVLSCDFDVTN
jgi:hypothetical protein